MANDDSPFTAPPPVQVRKPRRIRWWLIISIFAVPLLLIWFAIMAVRIGYTLRENRGQKQMFAEIEKLASDGVPIDNESIDALYRSRTSPDHVDEWLELLVQTESPEFKQLVTGVPGIDRTVDDELAFESTLDPDWKYAEVCQRLVDRYQEPIANACRLAADPTPVQFPIFFDSIETQLSELQGLREIGLLVSTDAHVAMHTGDGARAVRDCTALFDIGAHAEAVPGMIPRLVGIAIRQLAIEVLQRLVTHDLLSDDQLRSFNQRLKDHCQIGTRWADTLNEERGLYLPVFLAPAAALQSKKHIPARGHDAVHYIELMRQAIELDADKWPEFYNELGKLEAELRPDKGFSFRNIDRLLTQVVAPAFRALATAFIRDVQAHRLARLAIEIQLYERAHHRWPASLQELGEEASNLRPFGEKPFGTTFNGNEAVVWGFSFADDRLETPDEPIEPDPNQPDTSHNARWIWKLPPSSKNR